jgi:glutamine amidotransferase
MKPRISIVDYGIGNLFSVTRAFEHVGAEVVLARDAASVAAAERLVLPGVGAFRSCVDALAAHGLVDAVKSYARCGGPMLGICVGMQMLFAQSNEFGITPGLALIPGEVRDIPRVGADGAPHKIPHIGWNDLRAPHGVQWNDTLLAGLTPGEAAVYFVHSYTAHPADESYRVADADYDGCRISAVVRSGAVYGCQFHPEKSGAVGLQVIRNFVTQTA